MSLAAIPRDASAPVWLYAILPGDVSDEIEAAPLPGGGAPGLLRLGRLALLAGEAPAAEVRRTRRNMLAHAKALEAALAAGPVLPMRFGLIAAAGDAAAAAERQEEALCARLAALEGRAEYGLRISWEQPAAMAALAAARPDLAAERARLAKRGEAGRPAMIELGRVVGEALAERRKAAQKALLKALVPLADDHVLRAPETDLEALRAEFLLRRDGAEEFLAAARAAAEATGFAEGPPALRWIGPSPAYNFVDIRLDPAPAG